MLSKPSSIEFTILGGPNDGASGILNMECSREKLEASLRGGGILTIDGVSYSPFEFDPECNHVNFIPQKRSNV